MSEKEIALIENSILQARKEGLLKAGDSSMQSHGKLWGMDVFSWLNPKPAVLSATMDSFPFPIFWISSFPERNEVMDLNIALTNKIHFSLILDDYTLVDAKSSGVEIASVSNLNEAFDQIRRLKIKPSILLFTYSKSDWEYQKKCFNDYLSMAQVK
jgi:hypothetical protein